MVYLAVIALALAIPTIFLYFRIKTLNKDKGFDPRNHPVLRNLAFVLGIAWIGLVFATVYVKFVDRDDTVTYNAAPYTIISREDGKVVVGSAMRGRGFCDAVSPEAERAGANILASTAIEAAKDCQRSLSVPWAKVRIMASKGGPFDTEAFKDAPIAMAEWSRDGKDHAGEKMPNGPWKASVAINSDVPLNAPK